MLNIFSYCLSFQDWLIFVKLEFVRLVLFGMIYAYQTTALVARHHPIFLPYYISYMSAINQCIAIGTSWCFADTMLYKCEQKKCNTQKHKCLVQYIQPITGKYSNKAEGKCNDIAYPICFFHTVSLLCQIGLSAKNEPTNIAKPKTMQIQPLMRI